MSITIDICVYINCIITIGTKCLFICFQEITLSTLIVFLAFCIWQIYVILCNFCRLMAHACEIIYLLFSSCALRSSVSLLRLWTERFSLLLSPKRHQNYCENSARIYVTPPADNTLLTLDFSFAKKKKRFRKFLPSSNTYTYIIFYIYTLTVICMC